jgi:predicted porin
MQKKLIALAVASALAVPAAAMAAGDTTIYGVLDAGYSTNSTTIQGAGFAGGGDYKTALDAITFSAMTSSRIGFMHTEDLGNGMSLMGKIETGIGSNPNAGDYDSVNVTTFTAHSTKGSTIDATSLGNRELNLTLMIDKTAIKAGYGSTWIRDISLGYAPDPGGNLTGNILNFDGYNLSSNRAAGVTVTQDFGSGFSAAVQVTANTRTADNTADWKGTSSSSAYAGNGWLLGAKYAEGPISASAAYQDQKVTLSPLNSSTLGTDSERKIWIMGASYDMEVAKIIAEYANIKNDDSATSVNAKNSYLSFGGQVPLQQFLVFAQYSLGKVNFGGSGDNDQDIKGYTVGAKYNLSKASYGYLSVGNIKLDSDTGAGNAGFKADQVALGLVKTW